MLSSTCLGLNGYMTNRALCGRNNSGGFPGSSAVKNPSPAMQKTQVPSLGQVDPLEEDMETHCSILAWEIPWTEEAGELQSMGSQRVRHDLVTTQQFKK